MCFERNFGPSLIYSYIIILYGHPTHAAQNPAF